MKSREFRDIMRKVGDGRGGRGFRKQMKREAHRKLRRMPITEDSGKRERIVHDQRYGPKPSPSCCNWIDNFFKRAGVITVDSIGKLRTNAKARMI